MKSNVITVAPKDQGKTLLTLCVYFGALIALFLISDLVMAGGGGKSLGDVGTEVTKSMSGVAKLITAASYVAGVGFAMMGMLKFKAHKDNPTQVSLSQPIVLLCIAAGLVFLPNIISTGGQTIWGDGGDTGRADSSGGGLSGNEGSGP